MESQRFSVKEFYLIMKKSTEDLTKHTAVFQNYNYSKSVANNVI